MRSLRARTGAALAAVLAAAAITVSSAGAQPVPPGWVGPHYYWHGHYWHHRHWGYRHHRRFYRYY